ncbi:MAG TPA: metallopeptidase TldD-related protein, partial [Candidatus Kapabacteria bacterium]|nr:metallopeptidase TldD-related protein [Candidatus Kapabacteria bacterium]
GFINIVVLCLSLVSTVASAQLPDKTIGTIEKAMKDELQRSKDKLHLAGLIDPFYISYSVTDTRHLDVAASFGSLTRSVENHTRTLNLRLLINNYQFNDENFTDASSLFGGGSSVDMNLPIDDDYGVIRRSFWLATDDLFKDANETFTKKKAALERKQLSEEDKNLADFSKAPKVEVIEAPAAYTANKAQLEQLVKVISEVFVKYKKIQNCSVTLSYNNVYRIQLSTEEAHNRFPLTECNVTVQATAQAEEDGEPLSLAFTISELTPGDIPAQDILVDRTETLAKNLTALAQAKKYDGKEYSGPVLFEDQAANDFISEQIIAKFSAKREDVLGSGDVYFGASGKGPSFQKKLETRILPTSVSVTDNPIPDNYAQMPWIGKYKVDEEGIAPKKLELVKNGILKTLYMTRTPTKEVKDPNGHSRPASGGLSGQIPGAGVVEITDEKAKASADLKKELLKIAKEDGYDFAIVVRSMQQGMLNFSEGMSSVADLMDAGKAMQPALVYKIYADGHEELLRGIEINFPTTRDLKELQFSKEKSIRNLQIAAGGTTSLFGISSKVPATLIAPDKILVPELEARKKQSQAYPIKPIVEKPQ